MMAWTFACHPRIFPASRHFTPGRDSARAIMSASISVSSVYHHSTGKLHPSLRKTFTKIQAQAKYRLLPPSVTIPRPIPQLG